LPLVEPGDDLAGLLLAAVADAGESLRVGDVLVLAQKIVSKAEDRYVELSTVSPSERARSLAAKVDKDPRLVEVILSESNEVVRHRIGVLVVEHRNGYVLANAGIDQSNIEHSEEGERVLLLPRDPDASAARLRAELQERSGVDVGVLINDSLGRAWRVGTIGAAIGASGVRCLDDKIGDSDLFGRELKVTEVGTGDELAAAASLLMGQASEGVPAVLARGLDLAAEPGDAKPLLRDKSMDLFR
jgi:coenzyme F420-0:L-glutamate ligase/coenzyme F420-1:gamma-L-glutamate ligase